MSSWPGPICSCGMTSGHRMTVTPLKDLAYVSVTCSICAKHYLGAPPDHPKPDTGVRVGDIVPVNRQLDKHIIRNSEGRAYAHLYVTGRYPNQPTVLRVHLPKPALSAAVTV